MTATATAKFPHSTKPAPHLFLLAAGTGQHRLFPASGCAPPIHSKTACRGFKSFCPCHKTGGNTGFSPVSFFHVLHCYLVHFGSDFWFPHPSVPAAPLPSIRNAPGFAFFWLNRVRFPLFCCFSGTKFSCRFLCILPHSGYKLKPSVMPCRREVSFFT